jgi:hypothetical protein
MRSINLLSLVCLLIVMAYPAGAGDTTAWTLWPGESQTYQGVAIEWIVPASPANAIEAAGWLNFSGPQRKLEKVPLALRMRPDNSGPAFDKIIAYLDGAFFHIHFRQFTNNLPDVSQGIQIEASEQSDRLTLLRNHTGTKPSSYPKSIR